MIHIFVIKWDLNLVYLSLFFVINAMLVVFIEDYLHKICYSIYFTEMRFMIFLF